MADITEKLEKLTTDGIYVFAAIDFGTTFSGYAFATKSNKNIYMNKNWGESLGCSSYKTPTCVLTGPKNSFVAFGYDAEEKFNGFTTPADKNQHHLFRRFKMILHKTADVSLQTTIRSTSGKKSLAVDIFAMALQFLSDHLLESLNKTSEVKLMKREIIWLLTVPAIWSEESKQFMRVAAHKAGLARQNDSQNIVICLEPEVAAIFCRTLPLDDFKNSEGLQKLSFKQGTQYLVVDCGGGTVDIASHEILENGRAKEVSLANGGALGGVNIDEALVDLLKRILGEAFIHSFSESKPQKWLELMLAFDRIKRAFVDDGKKTLNLSMNYVMAMDYYRHAGKEIENAFVETVKEGISFSDGTIIISNKAAKKLFEPTITKIVEVANGQLRELKSPMYVLLVGGMGECSYLQTELRKNLVSSATLLVPVEAQLAVTKGAIMYGLDPNCIASRISRLTFGAEVCDLFDPYKHPPFRKRNKFGEDLVYGVFEPFVMKGDVVDVDKEITFTRLPINREQTSMELNIYSVDKDELAYVEFIDNPGMTFAGKVTVEMPITYKGLKREVKIRVILGGTEMRVFAEDVESGNKAKCTIDFLTK